MTISTPHSETTLLGAISRDLKMELFRNEPLDSYVYRLVYTASRFWIATICAGDDYGGTLGISKQAVLRRVRAWVGDMETLYSPRVHPFPRYGTRASSQKDVCSLVFDRMVETGDIVLHENGTTYRATQSRPVSLGSGIAAYMGLSDITDPVYAQHKVSGLVTFTANDDSRPWRPTQIKRDLGQNQSSWMPVADLGDMEFFAPYGNSLASQEAWALQPSSGTLTLGRMQGPYEYRYYIVNTSAKRAHHLDREQAKAIWFELRHEAARPARFAIEINNSDECARISASVPLHHLPLSIRKWLDLVSWPLLETMDDGAPRLSPYRCLVHKDLAPVIQSMIRSCHADVATELKE